MSFIDIHHVDFRRLYLPDGIALLDDAERTKAAGITNDASRRTFVKSRAALRVILSEYLECAPGDIRFHYNQYGKPLLSHSGGFHFNLSHSSSLGLVAISSTEVGVDIEQHNNRIQHNEVARQVFSEKEQIHLQNRVGSDRQAVFYNLWARKEAYLKARGTGFSAELEEISVSSESGEVEDLSSNDDKTQWYAWNITTRKGYGAAVSASERNLAIRHMEFAGFKQLLLA